MQSNFILILFYFKLLIKRLGVIGMIWVGIMLALFSSSPNHNRFISCAEKNFINQKIKFESNKKMVS